MFVLQFGPRIGYYSLLSAVCSSKPAMRRGAGVAEQGCLLSSYTGKTGVGGSNPPLSARSIVFDDLTCCNTIGDTDAEVSAADESTCQPHQTNSHS